MTCRRLILLCALVSLLTACSVAREPVPPPESPCAQPPGDETDGGVGGTGNAPDPCAFLSSG